MAPFPTQPPQEPALQQLGVEPVGLCPAVFPRYCHTRGMDHVRLYPTRTQPTRQPEAVAAGFEGQRNPGDLFSLVEGDGFEPSVPPRRANCCRHRAADCVGNFGVVAEGPGLEPVIGNAFQAQVAVVRLCRVAQISKEFAKLGACLATCWGVKLNRRSSILRAWSSRQRMSLDCLGELRAGPIETPEMTRLTCGVPRHRKPPPR
jgi:hypothetical protein